MNRRLTLLFLIITFSTASFLSCKKNDGEVVSGKVSLNVHAVHHTANVSNIRVYIKSNTLTWPGTDSTLYDKYLLTDSNGYVSFTQLFPGNYYIYASGYDSSWGANVIGYKQIILSEENIINNEMNVTLYVSE